jgi:hypothetical protein
MSHEKLGPKAFGLCLLAALSAMALAATGAQASSGHAYVNLTQLKSTVEIEALKTVSVQILSTFGAGETPLAISCTAILLHDGLLLTGGTGVGEILLSSCSTSISGLVKANCKPLEPIVVKAKTLLLHHNGDTYKLFLPQSGSTFTTIHLGELCAAGETAEIVGNFVTECGSLLGTPTPLWHHEDCNVEKVEQQVRQASPLLFSSHQLKFGTKAATLDGHINLLTKGTHVGHKWSVEALLP